MPRLRRRVAASATRLVLAILAEGETCGYAILKRVRELSGGHLKWTDGMLYPAATSRCRSSRCHVAALGENIILLVNLAWSAVVYARFLTGHTSFAALERWQTAYLPVYSVWAAFVVIAFPPLFSFI